MSWPLGGFIFDRSSGASQKTPAARGARQLRTSGKNGRDDQGSGDDVVLKIPRRPIDSLRRRLSG